MLDKLNYVIRFHRLYVYWVCVIEGGAGLFCLILGSLVLEIVFIML